MRSTSTLQTEKKNVNSRMSIRAGIIALLILFCSQAFAQMPYTRTNFNGAYSPLTTGGGATQIVGGVNPGDFSSAAGLLNVDDGVAYLALPFNFTYNGVVFTAGTNFIGIGTNGYAYFSTINTNASKVASLANTNLFITTTPNTTLAPWWDDLSLGSVNGITGEFLHQTTGSAGSQVLTLQWRCPGYFTGNPKRINFQIKLYETSNVIEFWYGTVDNVGSLPNQYNIAESASIGIESAIGGINQYIDGVLGSGQLGHSMLSTNDFPAYNFRFTPGLPVAIAGGTYSVGVGQTYRNLTEVAADLNHRGISGAVTFNLMDAASDTTAAGGNNIFPISFGPITGTSAANTITIIKAGAPQIMNVRGSDAGNVRNNISTAAVGTATEPIIFLSGADRMTFQNLDLRSINTGTTSRIDRGIYVVNNVGTLGSNGGSQFNSFFDIFVTLDRTNTSSIGIQQTIIATATDAGTANSHNLYRGLTIKNCYAGIFLNGTSTATEAARDVNNRITTTGCGTYNTIGDPSTGLDIGGGTAATQTYGVQIANQAGFTVSNNRIRNVSGTGTTDGIIITSFFGVTGFAPSTVSNNIINGVRNNSPTVTTQVNGIRFLHNTLASPVGTVLRVFNNAVSNITMGFTGINQAWSSTLGIKGMNLASTTTTTNVSYEIFNNSVSINGSGSPNITSTAFQRSPTVAGTILSIIRNNIFANFTGAQVAPASHYAFVNGDGSGATGLGAAGSAVTNNDLWIANTTQGFMARSNSIATDYATVALFQAAHAQATGNVDPGVDPLFFDNTNNLHATNPLLNGTGFAVPAYITQDLDCQPISNDIGGAFNINACPSGPPTASISGPSPSCIPATLTASTSAVSPNYQWFLNGVDVGVSTSTFNATVAGSYTVLIWNTGESCATLSAAKLLNAPVVIPVSVSTDTLCDGDTAFVIASAPSVYASSSATSTADEDIFNVTFGSLNNSSTCFGTAPGPGSVQNLYSNFTTSVAAPNITAGVATAFSVDANTCGGNFSNCLAIWIDYDKSGTFETPAERLYVSPTSTIGAHTESGNMTIPATAAPGLTRMRVVQVETTVPTGILPTGTYTWGETEDYNVNIVNPLTHAWSPSTGVSDTTILAPFIIPPIGTTTYTLTTTTDSGCVSTSSVTITNLGAGDPAPTTTGDTACAGDSAFLSASGLSTLNWYNAAVGGALVHTGTNWDSIWATTTTYFVESFNGLCPSDRTPVTVVVNVVPPLNATVTQDTICFGDSTSLSGTITTSVFTGTYLSGIAPTVAQCNDWVAYRASLTGPYSYLNIRGSLDPVGRTATNPANVQAMANALKNGLVFSFLESGITWSTGACGNACAGGGRELTAHNAGVSNCLCNNAYTIRPEIGNLNWGGVNSPSTCGAASQSITVEFSSGVNAVGYQWTPSTGLACDTCPVTAASPPTTTTYVLTVFFENGCVNTDTITVVVNQLPAAPDVDSATTFCGCGVSTIYADTNNTNTVIRWYDVPTGGTILGTGSPFLSPFFCGTKTFYAEEHDTITGCNSLRDSITIVPIVAPAITILSTDDTLCDGGESDTLTATSANDPCYVYTWSPAAGLSATTGATVVATPTVSTTYIVTGTDTCGSGCISQDTVLVNVGVTPALVVSADVTVFCEGDSATLNVEASDPGGSSIDTLTVTVQGAGFLDETTWTLTNSAAVIVGSGGPYGFGSNNVITVVVNPATGPYTFFIETQGTFNDNVANYSVACSGSTQVSGTVNGGQTFNSGPNINCSAPLTVTYAWSPATGLSATNVKSPKASPPTPGLFTYYVTVSNNGCTATDSITLDVQDTPPAPLCTGDSICGQDTANLTAVGTGGLLRWIDGIGGPIVGTGPTYNPFVTQTDTFCVFEENGAFTQNVGPLAGAPFTSANFGTTDYLIFDVTTSKGIIINTVDINTVSNPPFTIQTPAGTPIVVQLENNLGQPVGEPVTAFTGPPGVPTPITLNMFVPQGTGWRLRPASNPVLQVYTQALAYPYTIPNVMAITGMGGPGVTGGPQSVYRYFFNWNVTVACFSPPCCAIAVVNPAPPLTITPPGPLTMCDSGSVSLTAGGDPSWVNFNWSPAAGLSSTTGATVTATLNSPGTYVYTVTADDGIIDGCQDTETVVINVYPGPTVNILDTPFDTLCVGDSMQLNSISTNISVKQLGFSHNDVLIIPYNGINANIRSQYLFTAAELNAAGLLGPANITSMAFEVAFATGTTVHTNFQIRMAQGTGGVFNAPVDNTFDNPVFTTVFLGNVTPTTGWNTYVFTTPFAWNGTNNILIDVCSGTLTNPFLEQVYASPTGVNQTLSPTFTLCTTTGGTAQLLRPNVRFTGGINSFSWSPALGLSSSTVANPVFTNPGLGTYTYTLTGTDLATGCTSSDSVTIVVSTAPQTPIAAFIGDSVLCFSDSTSMRAFNTTGDLQWQDSPDGVTFTDIGGATNDTLVTPILTTNRWYRVYAYCTDTVYSNILEVEVDTPAIVSTLGDTICGPGIVCLQATTNHPDYTAVWYADSSGGSELGFGSTFCTYVTNTDTFWVEASADTSGGLSASGNVIYMRSNTQNPGPWSNNTNDLHMNAVFGAGNWTTQFFQTAIPANVFSSATKLVYIDGSDAGTAAMNTFLGANLTTIQNWVAGGGHLFLNCASQGLASAFGFGGVTNNFATSTPANIALGQNGHPIFNGPFLPVGSAWTGNSITHCFQTGGGITALTTGTPGTTCSEKIWGNGLVVFGGFTTTNFHSPQPQADNLRRNILAYLNTGFGGCSSVRIPVIAVVTQADSIFADVSDDTLCVGECATLTVTSPNPNYQYTWQPGNLSGDSVVVCPTTTTQYVVFAIDPTTPDSCQNSDTVTVTVIALPTIASITPSKSSVCVGDTVTICAVGVSPFPPPSGNYTNSPIVFAPQAPTGPVTVLANAGVAVTPLSFGTLDDGTWESIPLPAGFAFSYYGSTPTTFSVSTNGYIAFGALAGVNGCCAGQLIPSVATANNAVRLAHEDWNFTSGTLDYFTNGFFPNRTFVVRWTNVPHFGGGGGPLTGQLELNENNGTIEVHITSQINDGTGLTQGVENATGTLGTATPGRNAAVWNATNDAFMFSPPLNTQVSYAWESEFGNIFVDSSQQCVVATVTDTTTFYVIVTDNISGCTAIDSITINSIPLPEPHVVPGDTVVCADDLANGFYLHIEDPLYPGGYPAGTIVDWFGFGPQPGDSLFVNFGGQFYATVTLPAAAGGCVGLSDTSDILSSDPPEIFNIEIDTINCNGGVNGALMVQVINGTPPYNFVWYDSLGNIVRNVIQPGAFDTALSVITGYDTLSGVPYGQYCLVVTDNVGGSYPPPTCNSDSVCIILEELPPYVVTETHVDVLCFGYATGSIDLTVSGATPPYTYLWSNGETTEDISGLVAGTYTVLITDYWGCTFVMAIDIIENPQVIVGMDQSNVSCNGGSDGTATVSVSGGVPPYTYTWSNGDTTETAEFLPAGTHCVTITDAVNCDTVICFTITEPPLLDATLSQVNITCYGLCTGTATVTPFGGIPPYSYEWSDGQTTQTATGLCAGTYTVTITDSVGCVKFWVFTITEPDELTYTSTSTPVTCPGGSDGTATVVVAGGTPPYNYSWNTSPVQTTAVATGLTGGTWTVTITDALGCQLIVNVNVDEPDDFNLFFFSQDVTCWGGNDGVAQVNVTGGTPPYSYLWNTNPPQTTQAATGLSAGTWTVLVTDANGCTATGDVTINQPDSLALNASYMDVDCYGAATGEILLFVTGGVPPYTYIWSNGNTTDTNLGLVAGTYTATVTDSVGCVTTETFVISQPDSIHIDLTVVNVACYGGSTGSITANASGGTSPYFYEWNTGDITQTIANIPAGTYTVTVTDGNGCTKSETVVVTEPAELTCTCPSNVTNVSCFGGSNGTATAGPIGGTPPYSYLWSNGQTTQTANGLAAGTYTVTITDANGCIVVSNITITQPADLVLSGTQVNVSCNGGSNGSASVIATGGTPPYAYAWSTVPVQTTSTATGLSAGSYTVVVTDANGCTEFMTFNISQPSAMILTITNKKNVTCWGACNGQAKATVTGGTPPYTYLWSTVPPQTKAKATGLCKGTYTVTVTDANGCTVQTNVTITQPPKIVALYVVTNVSCFGGNNGAIDLTVTGGKPPYTYSWNTGATTQDVSGLTAGIYSVQIKDKNGCVVLANISIVQPPQLTCSTTGKNVKCFGQSNGKATVHAQGGTTPYSYLWSTGQTTATINGLPAGTYTVTVTDANGCTTMCAHTVTQPAVLSCTVTADQNVSCNGGNNGKATVNPVGGTAPYTYTWSTNPVQTTQIATGLAAGTYNVQVKDANNCVTNCSVTITQPSALAASCSVVSNVSCNGGNNGAASVTVSGGTPPYTYLWNSTPQQTTDNATGLPAGTYTVFVTDTNGCTISCTVTITEPPALVTSTSSTDASCNGGSDGTASVTASGGTPPYGYLWSNGATTSSISGLTAGTYYVTVTDANGCSALDSAVVSEPTSLLLGPITTTNVNCNGGNNGTATLNGVTGGTPPYMIMWSTVPPQFTATATGLAAGTYYVTVTDANGCTALDSAIISQPGSPLIINIINVQNIPCNGGLGSAEASPSGGTAPYSFLWSDGQTTAVATGLAAGTYVVTVTDANGCTASASVTISQPGTLAVSVSQTDVTCFGGNNGTATANATGGTPPYSYLWSNGQTTQTATGLAAGNYQVTVTDAGGCVAQNSVEIEEPSQMICVISNKKNVTCNGGSNGQAKMNVTGGTPPYTYLWSNGATTQTATGLAAGTYTVTATDANGCTVQCSATINQPAAIVVTISSVNVTCNGYNNGSATANVSGGTAPFNFLWSNLQVGQTATGLTAGTYTVTVTDFKGCTATASVTITQPSGINCDSSDIVNPLCYGGTGSVTIYNSGGTPYQVGSPYTYSWTTSPVQTTQTATGLPAGKYFVTVTDSIGCSTICCIIITEPPQLTYGISADNVSCSFGNDGSATVVASGGTPPYGYQWSNGASTSTISGLTASTYTVTITDANGCSVTASVTVSQPPPLTVIMSSSNASCGLNNGSASASVSGGVPPYTYNWSNGAITFSINNLGPGTYTVTVTDANGCTAENSVTITQTGAVSCSTTQDSVSCNGYSDGSATVTPIGGQPPYTFLWNTAPFQTTQTATGLAYGTYSVIVTDANGCSATCTVDVLEPAPLSYSMSKTDVNCNGTSTGSATIFVSGGTSPYSYLWSNGQTTQTASGLAAGTYYVTVTDANNCTLTAAVTILQSSGMSCNTWTYPATCGQANGTAGVNVFGGTPPYSYQWSTSPAQTNQIASNVPGGTYTVVVTDANGCTTSCIAVVPEPGAMSGALVVTDVSCNGAADGQIELFGFSGGTPPYTFTWSNGATTMNLAGLSAGTYTLTVTDSSGCQLVLSGTVNEPSALVLTMSSSNVTCFGYCDGSASVVVSGGTPPYVYQWNNGGNMNTLSNLCPGTYVVVVTDANGCTATDSVIITEPAPLSATYTVMQLASCGLANGSAYVTVTGGTAPYNYSWSTLPVQTTDTATNLAAGKYFVIITDANGCQITICVIVPSSTGLAINLFSPTYAGGHNIRCNGGSDGSINLTVTSGSGPFSYLWSNGATTEDLMGLTAGTYSVTVTNGACTATGSITLTEPTPLSLSTSQVNVSCFGGSNGTATALASGSTPPYSYLWSNGQTTQTATGLSAGAYTVTVSDVNGCTASAIVIITQPATALSISGTGTNVSCYGGNNGSIDITVSGGTTPYTYTWSDGETTEDRSNLVAGSYTVTVTDGKGCNAAICIVITEPTQLVVNTSKADVTCNGACNGTASASASGGTPPYSYSWNTVPAQTTASATGLCPGTYTVTVTDANGCIKQAFVTISQPAALGIVTSQTNASCVGCCDGSATATVSGGTTPYSYSWNTVPAQSNATATGLCAGTYQVTVTDLNGCTATAQVIITQPLFQCNTFHTETDTTWDTTPSGTNIGTYLNNNFAAVFPGVNGLMVGCTKTLKLTSPTAVRNALPSTGPAAALAVSLTNPSAATLNNRLASEVVALTLNVKFDEYDPNFAPTSTVLLKNLIITSGVLAGQTVQFALTEANKVLGGCSSPYSAGTLNGILELINQSWKGGIQQNSYLTCPAPPPKVIYQPSENWIVDLYPNPSDGMVTISFDSKNEENYQVMVMDLTGRLMFSETADAGIGSNTRNFNFSKLPKGVYMMEVLKGGNRQILRVVIQ